MPEPVDRAAVLTRRAEIQDLFDRPRTAPDDDEALAHWARYLCVLVSGYIESSARHLLLQHSSLRSEATVASYVGAQLRRFQNAKMPELLGLVGWFSEDWKDRIGAFAVGERADAVTSIVANRHLIAHGDRSDVSLEQMRRWFASANEVVDELANLCDG